MGSSDEHSAERLRIIFDHVEDAIFIKTVDGRYELINRAGAQILGFELGQVTGRSDEELFDTELAAELAAIDRSIIESGKSRTYEQRRMVAGVERVLSTTKVPYVEPSSGETYLIGISRDVTDQVRLDRQLADAERHAGIGVLAGGISHELKNPLTYTLADLDGIVQGIATCNATIERLTQALTDKLGGDEARELLTQAGFEDAMLISIAERAREARSGAERIRDIVDRLSRFARPADSAVSAIELHALLDSAIGLVSAELRYRARVVRQFGTVSRVRGQEQTLQQLFVNLLVGIARSMPEGTSDAHTIRITTGSSDEKVQIDIEDTGISGVEPGGKSAPARELGMSVARYLASSQNGSIEVEHRGSSVNRTTILLPAEIPKPEREAKTEPTGGKLPERARILIVDDEPLVRVLLRRMLGRRHDLSEASSGVEAVEILETGARFDAILCDLMMPRMTGMDVFEWLVQHRPDMAARIGFVTAGAFTDRGRQFLSQCNRPVLEKPFNRIGVNALLEEIVRV